MDITTDANIVKAFNGIVIALENHTADEYGVSLKAHFLAEFMTDTTLTGDAGAIVGHVHTMNIDDAVNVFYTALRSLIFGAEPTAYDAVLAAYFEVDAV